MCLVPPRRTCTFIFFRVSVSHSLLVVGSRTKGSDLVFSSASVAQPGHDDPETREPWNVFAVISEGPS